MDEVCGSNLGKSNNFFRKKFSQIHTKDENKDDAVLWIVSSTRNIVSIEFSLLGSIDTNKCITNEAGYIIEIAR